MATNAPFICNACTSEIAGFRYKCLQCVDFDLCGECMTSSTFPEDGHHPTHILLRLCCSASMTCADAGNEKDELVSSLSVLDGFSYFGQDVEGLGTHVGLASAQVQQVLDR